MSDTVTRSRKGLRRRGMWLVSAVVVVLGTAAVVGALLVSRPPSSLRERLLVASRYRPTPGRLTGETAHRPWRPRDADGTFDPDVARELGNNATGDADPLDVAVITFLRGDLERAIVRFELASHAPPTATEALTDLSAVYIARFEAEHDCLDLLRAVHAADRGLVMEPANHALLFNRATALSRLGTRFIAEAAWRQVERSSGELDSWPGEAAIRLRELKQPGANERWRLVLPRIEYPHISQSELDALVLRFPANARVFAEEQLLPRWASAFATGDAAAERSLQLATAIAAALQRSRGEELLADAVISIRSTIDTGSAAQQAALVRGLQQFGVGVAYYNESSLASAKEPLTRAAADLAALGNPLHHWASFYLAIGEYYENANRGLVILDRLLAEIPAERYPALTGRIEWIAGTIDKVQGRIQSSVRRYERSATSLRRAGGEPAAAFANVLLAESYTLLGEHSMAWDKRCAAFQQVPLNEGLRRRIAMWIEAKEALFRQGSLPLAGPLVDEAAATAEAWGRPLGHVTALLDRASYRLEIGHRNAALEDLRRAQAAVAQMEPSALRDQMRYLALITEGLCYEEDDPQRAAELLRDGLEGQGATGKRFDAITYTTALAEAQIASGDVNAGAASLERALSIFEDIRATVENPVSRMQAFRQAQPAFDRLIDLHMTSLPTDREEVFLLAERSRARVLLELRNGDRRIPFARLRDLERLVHSGVALVSYVVLHDRLLAWVVEDGRARQVTLNIRRADLERSIDRFRLELTGGGDTSRIREAAVPLYDRLIRPLALSRHAGQPLIIVPDRLLARLPFAALVDRESRQYLIEQRAVSIAPSATLLVQREAAADDRALNSALVISVSRSGTWRGRALPALPQTDREAEAVAALYPVAWMLRGSDATRENFLRRSISTDVIHFAGHAVVDLDALRRSVLLFTKGPGEELAPLSFGELLDAGFPETRLVVLAACGTQDSLADDREGTLGLAGAFVAAGVDEVVASPLDVDDTSSASVMVAFHRHYRKDRSAAIAFRNAVLDLLRSRSAENRSPAAWGGFTVIQGSL